MVKVLLKLFLTEMYKIWSSRQFILLTVILILTNLLLMSLFCNGKDGEPSSDAWKKIDSEMHDLTMEEKITWIEKEYERVTALDTLNQIENLVGTAPDAYINELLHNYDDVIRPYRKLYLSGKYLKYDHNITSEYSLVSQVRNELKLVSDYEAYIEDIQKRAEVMANISLFHSEDGNSYDERCIRQAAGSYERLKEVSIDYSTQKGLVTALNFTCTDILLIVFMLMVTGELILHEKDSGMMTLIRVLPGKNKSAAVKYMTMTVNMSLMSIILYISNLIYCNGIFGLGDLGRSIQSVLDLRQCLLKVSVAGYIALFLLFKSVAAWTIGVWVLIAAILTEKIWSEVLLSLMFILGHWCMRIFILPGSRFMVIRCSSLISFMDTNELLGNYAQVNFAGYPVYRYVVEIAAAVIWIVLLTIFYQIFISKIAFVKQKKTADLKDNQVKRKINRIKLGTFERDRLILGKKGWMVCLIFLGLCLYLGFSQDNSHDAQTIIYRSYYKMFEGRMTQRKADKIQEENDKFRDIYEMEDKYALGAVSIDAYNYFQINNYEKIFKKNIFNNFCYESMQYLKENPDAWIVYGDGYEQAFDFDNENDSIIVFISMMMICCLMTPVFSNERSSGFYKIVLTTVEGYKKIASERIKIAWMVSLFISLSTLTINYIPAFSDISFISLMAPAKSLSSFVDMPEIISILMLVLLQIVFRTLGCFIAVLITYIISWKIGKTLPSICCEIVLLCLPVFLSWQGMNSFYWISLYPLFHFCAYLGNKSIVMSLMIYCISAVCMAVALAGGLVNNYRKAGQW